jgi:hypothetical protein
VEGTLEEAIVRARQQVRALYDQVVIAAAAGAVP